MADTGKQSPLGVNVLGSLLQNTGLWLNPVMAAHVGACTSEVDYVLGTMCNNTCLRLLTYAIHDAYVRGQVDQTPGSTYDNLISIGAGVIPALGNSKPTTFTWTGPANTGDPTGLPEQSFSWNPYTGEITSWGYIRLLALQARHEANYNDTFRSTGEYRDFLGSWMTSYSFVEYSNAAILASDNSKTFLEGTYSNMNDLMSADVAGVNLALPAFGQDFIALGKAIDLASIATFGLPSNLLMTLQRYNALTNSVSLALLATGMSTTEINEILGKVNPVTDAQERYIYSAFSIIVGQDLADVCIPLNCKTVGLDSLADLLNPMKLFPNSYISLTVPVYNAVPTDTNSKTYYPIYEGNGVSSILTSMTNIDFGSYIRNALPNDIAVAAGAFSVTMQQIRNIASTPVEKFAQVVGHIETTKGLTLVGGTTVPVNTTLANAATSLISLGSGPQGTYTMSDFFGCMSGLPYNVTRIQDITAAVRDVPGEAAVTGGDSLYDIYKNLYLKVTWERSTASVQYTTYIVESPPLTFTTWYHVTGVTLTDQGGGYGFGGAAAPAVTMTGGSATTTIGIDKTNVGTFGRVTALNFSSGADITTVPAVSIAFPPGGVSFSNPDVQTYITQANFEIAALRTKFPTLSTELNTIWDDTGTQLTIEQRARSIGLSPVPTPRSNYLSSFPTTQYSFVDSIPRYGLNTSPHMSAQTLEAISNMLTVGGQSIVAMMRQSRNQDRLALAGVTLDNNIPATLPVEEQRALIANNTDSYLNQDLPTIVAIVATAEATVVAGEVTDIAITDPGSGYTTPPTVDIIPAGATATAVIADGIVVDITIDDPGSGYTDPPVIILNGGIPTVTTSPEAFGVFDPDTNTYTMTNPAVGGNGQKVDTGQAAEPGSLAGSPYTRLIPANLNVIYTSDILLPATLTPAEAINAVIECNCDCWVSP